MHCDLTRAHLRINTGVKGYLISLYTAKKKKKIVTPVIFKFNIKYTFNICYKNVYYYFSCYTQQLKTVFPCKYVLQLFTINVWQCIINHADSEQMSWPHSLTEGELVLSTPLDDYSLIFHSVYVLIFTYLFYLLTIFHFPEYWNIYCSSRRWSQCSARQYTLCCALNPQRNVDLCHV